MRIFNRWGKEVYNTNNMSKFWDGTHNGNMVQQGVYTYYIDIIGDDLKSFSKLEIDSFLFFVSNKIVAMLFEACQEYTDPICFVRLYIFFESSYFS